MYITQKETAPVFDTGYGEYIYKLAGPANGDLQQHSIVYVEIKPGCANRLHYHPQVEETYYILSGQAQVTLNDKSVLLKPGQLISIPAGTRHKISNPATDQLLCLIATCATPWTEDCSVFLE